MKKLVIFFSFILLSFTTLIHQDSVKNVLINDLTYQLSLYKTLSQQDSILLETKNKQIVILNETIDLYDERLKKVDKWYNKAWVGIIEGMALTTLSSWIIKNVGE